MLATKAPSLPLVVLKDRTVPLDVLSFIPLGTMEKYQVAVFDKTEKVLKLAIVHPEAFERRFLCGFA